jgi:hypothetical protein
LAAESLSKACRGPVEVLSTVPQIRLGAVA